MEEQQQNDVKQTISAKDFFLMLVVALFFDGGLGLIQLIPVAGSVAASVFNVVPFMGFFIWYKLLGLDFSKPKNSKNFIICSLIEFIPVLNALPGWTAEVVIMYIIQKKDAILAKAAGLAGGAAGATAGLSVAAKATGAKDVSKNLKETSEKLKEESNEYKARITPVQNKQIRTVGDGITTPKQANDNEPDNLIPYPTKEKSPFSNSKQEPEHAEEWTFPRKAA